MSHRVNAETSQGGHTQFYLKNRLNMKISIEGELVGAHDGLIIVLWRNYLIEAQS